MSQQVACVFGNSDGSPRTSASFQISRVCPRANGVFASEGAKVGSVCRLCMHSHQNERRGMVSCCGERFPLSLLFCLRANHQPPSPCDHSRVNLAWEHTKDVQHYVLLYHQHQPASDLSCSPYVPFRLAAPLPLLPLRQHEMATTRLTYFLYVLDITTTTRLHTPASASTPAEAGPTSALRPYQARVVDRAVELYGKGTRRLLVPLATGLGKTVVFTHLSQVHTLHDSKTCVYVLNSLLYIRSNFRHCCT